MKKLILTMMSGLLLMGCTQQNDLTFNEMVNQTQEVAKGIDETALFYESTATKELTGVKSVFAGINNTTIEVLCNSKGETESKVINSPFMEDEVIHLPVKLTLEEAEQILLDAGYGTGVEGVADWSEVVLRRPLEPGFNFAQYIFTTSKGFVSVNARTGEIEPVGLEGCPCPFKNPCICPEEKSSDGDDPYIMVWNIDKGAGVSLKVTGGQEWEGQAISPKVGESVNEGYHYDYVIFQTLNVDIYTGASGGGQKLGSTTIEMVTKDGNTYPLDSKGLINLKYNPSKSTYPGPTAWQNRNWFDITYVGVAPPSVLTNEGWNNGLGNSSSVAVTDESFFVTDYGDENGRWTAQDGAIYQSTATIDNNVASRAYVVKLVEGQSSWSYEQGIGVAKDGLWQIDIKCGSNGEKPYCETFYIAERKNLAPGVSNYLDGHGGGKGGGGNGREIDIMETQWNGCDGCTTDMGPQVSLGNADGGTYWNQTEAQNIRVNNAQWSDIGGINSGFATYGVLIRGNNLWLYAYKPDGTFWYSTDAIPNTNTTYVQEGNFVPYIGTWSKPATAGDFKTGYNNFIYLDADDDKIKGLNPKDNPEAFGAVLK